MLMIIYLFIARSILILPFYLNKILFKIMLNYARRLRKWQIIKFEEKSIMNPFLSIILTNLQNFIAYFANTKF